MMGQFEAAATLCLNEQRYTEALLLAHLGGQELLFQTQKRYFDKVQTSSTKVRRVACRVMSTVKYVSSS
jgi:protein transport protein SEC31